MWSKIRHALVASVDMLLPPTCLLCRQLLPADRYGPNLCSACIDSIVPLNPAHCSLCAQPFAGPSTDTHLCQCCLQKPPAFSLVHPLGSYQSSIKDAVHRLKYRKQLPLAEAFGVLLAEELHQNIGDNQPQLLIPVPLHRKRLRERGYNQALELARPVARRLQIPLAANLLQRKLDTPPQQGLNAEERQRNLRNAFTLSEPLQNQRVLLLDDVMTTGGTIRECCQVLHSGGASEIQVAVLGRA